MESTLLQTIKFFNSKEIGEIATRKEFLKVVGRSRRYTRDAYRNSLTKLGFLEIVGPGKYKLIKRIPEQLSFCKEGFYLKKSPMEKLFEELDKLTEEKNG